MGGTNTGSMAAESKDMLLSRLLLVLSLAICLGSVWGLPFDLSPNSNHHITDGTHDVRRLVSWISSSVSEMQLHSTKSADLDLGEQDSVGSVTVRAASQVDAESDAYK